MRCDGFRPCSVQSLHTLDRYSGRFQFRWSQMQQLNTYNLGGCKLKVWWTPFKLSFSWLKLPTSSSFRIRLDDDVLEIANVPNRSWPFHNNITASLSIISLLLPLFRCLHDTSNFCSSNLNFTPTFRTLISSLT